MTVARKDLVATLIGIQDKLPCGYQVGTELRLDQVIQAVEKLFEEHDLPLRSQLIAELALWRSHVQDGVRLMERGYELMSVVIRSITID